MGSRFHNCFFPLQNNSFCSFSMSSTMARSVIVAITVLLIDQAWGSLESSPNLRGNLMQSHPKNSSLVDEWVNASYGASSMAASIDGGVIQSAGYHAWCMEHATNWFGPQRVYAARCNGRDTQKWVTSGLTIKSFDNAKCLDNDISFFTPGRVNLVNCNGQDNQKWWWSSKEASIRSGHDGKCVEINLDGNYLYVNHCDGGNNQKWVLA